MSVYVRSVGMANVLVFPMNTFEEVETAIRSWIRSREPVRIDYGELGFGLLNFSAMTQIHISSLTPDEAADGPSPTPEQLELIAHLNPEGISVAGQAEDYLKRGETDR